MIEKIKVLLGIDEKDEILQYVIDTVREMVINYCNIDEIPKTMENTFISMCIDFYRSQCLGQKEKNQISSISEGDVSVSFYSGDMNAAAFLDSYKYQLNAFRKTGR